MRIRLATETDIELLVALEQVATDHPWNLAVLSGSFSAGHGIFLLEDMHRVLGYAVFSTVLNEAELLNFVIAAPAQAKGVGTQFLTALLQRHELADIVTLYLEVRESNQAAIRLYEKLGFKFVELRKGYYPTTSEIRENAVLMSLHRGSR